MRRPTLAVALLVSVGVIAGVAVVMAVERAATAQQTQPIVPPGAVMDPRSVAVRVLFGLRAKQPEQWTGEVTVSGGKLLDVDVWRSGLGDRADQDGRFKLRARGARVGRRRRVVTETGLILSVAAPASAQVHIKTNHGDVAFKLADLAWGRRLMRLGGRVAIDRVAAATTVAATEREEDFPAAAAAPDGSVYAAYIEHTHLGPPFLDRLKTAPKDFSAYRPSGGGDRLMVARLSNWQWGQPEPLTSGGLDLWRPAVAVDGSGTVWVVWSQNVDGNWDLYARSLTGGGKWSQRKRLTREPGADVNVTAVRARSGAVWLAWQAWRGGQFDIHVATLGPEGLHGRGCLGSDQANEWSPAIAADWHGNVYVAFDTYEAGNYDVKLAQFNESGDQDGPVSVQAVACSDRFEVRPALACDSGGRLWIAWEQRAANWGKDDWGAVHPGPGTALYRAGSTVRVVCWSDGKLQATASPLLANFPTRMQQMNSFPRLGVDGSGRVWLAVRHRGRRRGPAGTFWYSYLTCYDGDHWSGPVLVPYSDNLLDNRPALLSAGPGRLLVVYSGDGRNRFARRPLLNNHLFAAVLDLGVWVPRPELAAVKPPAPPRKKPAIHPNEPQDVARLRSYRIEVAGHKYQLLRGEFHRHTEISGDGGNDGALEDMWRYAMDAARMDWIGNGDHDNGGGREYTWWLIQKTTDIFHHPPHFVPMFSYERSVRYPDGHRNVMFARRGVRTLPRLLPQPGEQKPNNVSDADTPMLYRYLKQFDGICAVHTSATSMGTDWRSNDPQVEPFVEIYQGDRHNYEHPGAPRSATKQTQIGGYQAAGFVWNALAKGYRLGFQASSDHISTHISYAIAVAENPTRQGLLEAFKKRHCYAATDNIILTVACGQHLMGDEFTCDKPPTLQVTAIGTNPIAHVSIIKDLKYAYEVKPNRKEVKIRWTDDAPNKGGTSLYYVRIEQSDGQIAWASPMWIRYQP